LYRYHFFTPHWKKELDLAEINDGSGNNLFIVFSSHGVIMKGFDHESEMSPYAREDFSIWPGIYDSTPLSLSQLLDDESLEKSVVTFCIWRESTDNEWKVGNVVFPEGKDDGSEELLELICPNPKEYKKWADEYFEADISLEIITKVYDSEFPNNDEIMILNSECNLEEIKDELQIFMSLLC